MNGPVDTSVVRLLKVFFQFRSFELAVAENTSQDYIKKSPYAQLLLLIFIIVCPCNNIVQTQIF